MDLPLHPMFVHFPIVLAVALPVTAAVILWRISRRQASCRNWRVVVVLAVLLAVSASVAVSTGGSDEEAVEAFVPEAALETHEDRADVFHYLAWGIAALAAVGLMRGAAGHLARFAATGGSVLLLVAAIGVGHAGAELVYRYGAAQAHVTAGSGISHGAVSDSADDDDDDD